MKEKPINLKDEEVRLLLNGATLLVVPMKKQPIGINHEFEVIDGKWGLSYVLDWPISDFIPCPYQPGDVLWVREAFAHATDFGYATDHIFYRATYVHGGPYDDVKLWHPAQHMPRELARPELSHITVVKVECCQVQGILPAEVLAIGVDYEQHSIGLGSPCDEIRMLHAFQNHFNTLYPGAWDNNLWVWKIWRAA